MLNCVLHDLPRVITKPLLRLAGMHTFFLSSNSEMRRLSTCIVEPARLLVLIYCLLPKFQADKYISLRPATMTEPNAEDVDTLMALTDNAFARDVAIRRLKVKSGLEDLKFSGLIEQGNNNNLEQAINDYFEDPTSSKVESIRA